MNLYRSPDTDAAGAEPSYARLAARLKKNPTYEHPDLQALLDRLATGELDSEECLQLMTQNTISRTANKVEHEKQVKQLDTKQQLEQQKSREKLDAEIAQNATAAEPKIVDQDAAGNPEENPTPKPATDTPASPISGSTSGSSTTSATTRSHGTFAGSGLGGSSGSYEHSDERAIDPNDEVGGFETIPSPSRHEEVEEDERGSHYED